MGKHIERSSPYKLLGQLEPHLVTMVLGWPLSQLRPAGLGPNQHDRQVEPKLTLDPLEKHIQRSSSLKPPSQLE